MSIYGILIGLAVVIGIELIKRYTKEITYFDITLSLIFTLVGARLLFILHNIPEIQQGLINHLAIWDGGLAFYGGLIGLLLSLLLISKKRKLPIFNLSDNVLLFLPLVHSIGRIGNFFNNEIYGKPTTLPWGIYIPKEYRTESVINYSYFHPVFLYESVLNIFNFLILLYLKKKKVKTGVITGIYLINYSLIRIFTNTVRIDKEYFLHIETSDIFSVLFFTSGILILIMTNTKIKQSLAVFFSKVLILLLIVAAMISVIYKVEIDMTSKMLLALFTLVVPMLIIYMFFKLGITSDLNLSKREERPKVYLAMSLSFLLSYYIAVQSSNVTLITMYTPLIITFLATLVITNFWKISYHMVWGTLSFFFLIYLWQLPQLYLLSICIPLIAWSRVELKRHTVLQVIGGVVLTLTCIFLVLTFLKF